MKKIKAIVLTFDKYRVFTDHMIKQYERLWPDNPFVFRIPYQELAPTIEGSHVEYVKTDPAIKKTVLGLIEDLDDEDWIYWCIDDKYPLELDVPRIEKMLSWLFMEDRKKISSLLFCRCRNLLRKKCLKFHKVYDDDKNLYFERKAYEQIWIHQLLRVKVIRHLFEQMPDDLSNAKVMDQLKRKIEKPKHHRLYVRESSLAIFAESTSRGLITQNCYESLIASGLEIPSWHKETSIEIVGMGTIDADKPFSILSYLKRE